MEGRKKKKSWRERKKESKLIQRKKAKAKM